MPHRDFSGAVAWLRAHGISDSLIAELFGLRPQSIKMIAWRYDQGLLTNPIKAVTADLLVAGDRLDLLLLSPGASSEAYIPRTRTEVIQLEHDIDDFGRHFWEEVQNHRGAQKLGLLLRKVSRPRSLLLKRAAARLYHLLAEIYVHAGFCLSALTFASRAYATEESIFKETRSRVDVYTIAKTCLLVSHAFLLRAEFDQAHPWIVRSKQAFDAAGCSEKIAPYIDPEVFRQLAVLQIHAQRFDLARQNFEKAGALLPLHNKHATDAQVRDVGERFLNFVSPQVRWEEGFLLKDFAFENWPEGDIHQALNVNWAAGVALSAGSPEGEWRGVQLLDDFGHLSRGYMHQETVTELLKMTRFLPHELRRGWVQFSFYYNAFRNK